ncbi:M28 family peptidase [Maribacter sp. MMG018]|uniref:M28 family peptidase n=1 Tax=Maribacter sp. MMG018 TaxID=2822688 RepID=UPI001B392421|nr:M28 family peptidase [Maribacter sp. MMG018]MBQ4913491.1 M28 family peptidase [Maribacter sp. MMG018]
MGKITINKTNNGKRAIILLPFFLLGLIVSFAQKPEKTSDTYFNLVRPQFSGDIAYKTTEYVAQYWRVPGNTGFNNSVYWIADALENAGYVLETKASPTDRLTYRIEKRPMEKPTWEPVSASLQIVGDNTPLLVSSSNRNMTYLNSASTPKTGITADIVHIKPGDDLSKLKIKGKVAYIEEGFRNYYKELVAKGVLGVITYDNPPYLQPEKNKTSIQFRSLPPQTDTNIWGIALSYEAKEKLEAALKTRPTTVHVNIQTKIYKAEELTIIANIKGAKKPSERMVFSAHIQEPGANDNASGVGAQLEMAIVAANLAKTAKVDFNRTLTFLWGDEISSTHRYIQENKERANGIKWGISLDMVGENTALTGGSFLIEKMPDPSAIWTRGKDKHSEWGGQPLSLEQMKPHYLNDFIIQNFKKQGKYAHWEVNTNPFEGGSDHTPFLRADIPGLLLWHFTDQFYHTDNDRIDKVSQETLKNVGTAALASALELVNGNSQTALHILSTLEKVAKTRLKEEFELSKNTLNNNSTVAVERQILEAWEDWYLNAFETLKDLGEDVTLSQEIENAQHRLSDFNKLQIKRLK